MRYCNVYHIEVYCCKRGSIENLWDDVRNAQKGMIKMRWKKTAMSFLLAGCITVSVLPTVSLAVGADTAAQLGQKNADSVDSGTCGENLTWTLDADGTLTISGTGEMEFDSDEAPWYSSKDQIVTVVMQSGVTSIAGGAFAECGSLTEVTIPDSVESIEVRAFSECTSLESIAIPGSVTDISRNAFGECSSLTDISVDSSNPAYCSEDGVVFDKDKTQLCFCPGGKTGMYRIPDGVKRIAGGAFSGCGKLTGVTIPDSVDSLGESVFTGCTGLESMTIPDGVDSIPAGTFSSCTGLASVTIPDSVTYIDFYAFYGCTSLKQVTIPDSVTSIDEGAFQNCSGLENVTIGSSVKYIRTRVFEGCASLKTIYFRGNAPKMEVYAYYSDSNCDGAFLDVIATAYYPEHATGWEEVIAKDYTGPDGKLTWVTYNPSVTTKPVNEIFSDIPANAWYIPYVQYAYDNGLMSGTSDTTFEPNSPLTRAMVAQILYAHAGKPEVTGASPFTDVANSKAWYYNAVVWANQNGIVNGYDDNTFRPMTNVTREQLAVMLYAHAGKPEATGSLSGFADAGQVHSWAEKAMLWANQNGIISGSESNGKRYLKPQGNATRAEAATMLTQYLKDK